METADWAAIAFDEEPDNTDGGAVDLNQLVFPHLAGQSMLMTSMTGNQWRASLAISHTIPMQIDGFALDDDAGILALIEGSVQLSDST
eukprot:243694-Prymnesium_polylepis.1